MSACSGSLAVRVRDLLDVPVDANDGLSQIVCEKCKRLVERLEKSADELVELRKKARDSYTLLYQTSSKAHKGDLGASPDTQKARPPSKKLAAKRLDFGQGLCDKVSTSTLLLSMVK